MNDGQHVTVDIAGELEALEQRHVALFGLNPDPTFALDADGRLVAGNDALTRLVGLPLRELLGRPFLSIVTSDDADRMLRHFRRALAGEAQNFAIGVVSNEGREIQLGVTLAATWVDGVIDGVHGIGRDVTREREVERALRDVEERYSLLADNVLDMISLHDTMGNFLYASPSAWHLLGYHHVELVGRSVYELVEPADVPVLRAAHEAILRREGRSPAAFRARRSDGSIRWFETTARMVTHEETGAAWRIIGVTRDISERRAFEQQFLQSQKMEALGRLAGAVAHDFNNVLTVIGGHAELLTQQLGSERTVRGAEHIREAAMRAAALARRLLAFGRGSGDELTYVDANAVLLELQPLLVRLLEHDVRLDLELEPDLLAIHCAPSALEQIAMNLAVNARDAMPGGGRLIMRTQTARLEDGDRDGLPAGDYVLLTATDTGEGIQPEILGRIFEPFFTTKSDRAGTGLGLSTVYTLVREAGGAVAVDSVPGTGTSFRLFFPGHAVEPAVAQMITEPAGSLAGSETILVAEDDAGVRGLVTAILQRYGYNVMTAVDGRQALELHRTFGHLVDLIVTDINMPDVTGPELINGIHAAGSAVPVLYISGFTADVLPPAGSAPRRFLPKPFTPVELAQAVRQTLALRTTSD
jgi:two-component system, cell cycle sensor histidine kinase and response regulator CckA